MNQRSGLVGHLLHQLGSFLTAPVIIAKISNQDAKNRRRKLKKPEEIIYYYLEICRVFDLPWRTPRDIHENMKNDHQIEIGIFTLFCDRIYHLLSGVGFFKIANCLGESLWTKLIGNTGYTKGVNIYLRKSKNPKTSSVCSKCMIKN